MKATHPSVRSMLVAAALAAIWGLCGTTSTFAQTTWHVPGDFDTIQEAIDAATPAGGDEIIVAPGTYNEAINFLGKAIHLRSSDGPEVTIIDATGLFTSVVRCVNGEGSDTILEGFTITGGVQSLGGGMRNSGTAPAGPTVTNCIFTGNSATLGGGMYNANASPTVTNCVFDANSAEIDGGGMYNTASSPNVTNCHFVGNEAVDFGGGGMYNKSNSHAIVSNCVFEHNTAIYGGAMANEGNSATVTNCTFIRNEVFGFGGGAIANLAGGSPPIGESFFCDNHPDHINGSFADLGGNEFSDECPDEACPADLTGDGHVGVPDLLQLLACWGPTYRGCEHADLTGSQSVGVADLLELLSFWGPCP